MNEKHLNVNANSAVKVEHNNNMEIITDEVTLKKKFMPGAFWIHSLIMS